jgi:23S rRNA (guanine745-N1)-methyltransferase
MHYVPLGRSAQWIKAGLAGEHGGVLDDVVPYLTCAHCGAALARAGASLRCRAGHVFDIARQGYVSLIHAGARIPGGDTAAMVAARAGFLAAGHFAGLAAELGQAADDAAGPGRGAGAGCVIDVGAGTGHYLAAVLDRLPDRAGLALDVSRFALRRGARAHPRIGAVRCDAWRRLPVADGAAALALNVFAPRNGAELRRVLSPAGRLLVVTPMNDHLSELVGPLGLLTVDRRKPERLAATLSPHFELAARREHRAVLPLDREAVGALAAMGPSSWHTDRAALEERIARLREPAPVTFAVTLSVYRPSPGPGRRARVRTGSRPGASR